jgi:hypothetical protein
LQRVPSLDAAATVGTVANRDIERPHDRPDLGQIFLILRRVPRRGQMATAVRAARRERCRMPFIDVRRDGTMRFSAVRGAQFAARPAWSASWCAPARATPS